MKVLRFCAYFCAFLSLVLSLAMIGFWICGVWELKVVNLNTFVGVTVALLGMIVTIAIAWQIYNAIDMRNKIEELKQLEDKLKIQEKSLEQFKLKATDKIYVLAGYEFDKSKDYLSAFYCYITALEASMQLNKSSNIEGLLNALERINKITAKTTIKNVNNILADINETNKRMKSLSTYRFIKERYEPSYNEFISKVK